MANWLKAKGIKKGDTVRQGDSRALAQEEWGREAGGSCMRLASWPTGSSPRGSEGQRLIIPRGGATLRHRVWAGRTSGNEDEGRNRARGGGSRAEWAEKVGRGECIILELLLFQHGIVHLIPRLLEQVAIYMPMILELPIAMLACARIGAIHSVVFGGFSAEAFAVSAAWKCVMWEGKSDFCSFGRI